MRRRGRSLEEGHVVHGRGALRLALLLHRRADMEQAAEALVVGELNPRPALLGPAAPRPPGKRRGLATGGCGPRRASPSRCSRVSRRTGSGLNALWVRRLRIAGSTSIGGKVDGAGPRFTPRGRD